MASNRTDYDITIFQGEDFDLTVTVDRGTPGDWDITGLTIAAKIRETFDGDEVEAFTPTITDGPNGEFTLTLTAVETAALVGPGGDERKNRFGHYDVEITDAGVVTRVLQGRVSLSQEATK